MALAKLYGRWHHWSPFAVTSAIAAVLFGLSLLLKATPQSVKNPHKRYRRSSLFGGSCVDVIPQQLDSPILQKDDSGGVLAPKDDGDTKGPV